MMSPEDKQKFIFEQTVNLLSGLLSTQDGANPEKSIDYFFENTYKALAEEFDKPYIRRVK